MDAGKNINNRIAPFLDLLENLKPESISSEIYCCKYLGHLLEHKKYYLSIYADVLNKLVTHSEKSIKEISLIDFGAGNGLLGLFAKFCGFKKVFINDIDPKFVLASQNLAQQLGFEIDGFLVGDIHNVQFFFKTEIPDAIIGTDVIEHIYNLEDFFKTIRQINPNIVSVFTTASNPKNYYKVSQLKKLQIRDEFKGGTPDDFVLFGDAALEPFLEMRKKIILLHLKNAEENTVLRLAKATRGMNEVDILAAIIEYDKNGTVPTTLSHPTNTCNPVNGSWTERILTIPEYVSIYNSYGMNLKVFNGFYDENKPTFKKMLNKILNNAVFLFGMPFAPYIIFVGYKK